MSQMDNCAQKYIIVKKCKVSIRHNCTLSPRLIPESSLLRTSNNTCDVMCGSAAVPDGYLATTYRIHQGYLPTSVPGSSYLSISDQSYTGSLDPRIDNVHGE